jgi:hypothetical protein
MKLFLHSDKTIKDLNREFAAEFPFLRFRFFKRSHLQGERSKLNVEVPQCTQLIDIVGVLREEMIEIKPNNTVKDVEQFFLHHTGLPVQILRKQADTWLETTDTDGLTLRQQNDLGREAAEPLLLESSDRFAEWK